MTARALLIAAMLALAITPALAQVPSSSVAATAAADQSQQLFPATTSADPQAGQTTRYAAGGTNGETQAPTGQVPAGLPSTAEGYPNHPPTNGTLPYAVNTPAVSGLPVTMSLGLDQKAWSRGRPAPGQVSLGHRNFYYAPATVMPIKVRQFAPTTLILPDWERIKPDAVFPGVGWIQDDVVSPNTVEIRVTRVGFDAPLKIFGSSGNIYFFWVTATGTNDPQVSDLIVTVQGNPPVSATEFPDSSSAWPTAYEPSAAAPSAMPPVSSLPAPLQQVIGELPPQLRAEIPDLTKIRVPHLLFEKHKGDAALIAPVRVVEDGVRTYFDFGSQANERPRPTIEFLLDGVERPVDGYVHRDYPQVVIVDRIGSFTLRMENHIVCVLRTDHPWAGLHDPVRLSSTGRAAGGHG